MAYFCPECEDIELEMVTDGNLERGSFECPECLRTFSESDLDDEDSDDDGLLDETDPETFLDPEDDNE